VGVTDEVWLAIALLRKHSPLWRAVPRDVLRLIARRVVLMHYRDLVEEGREKKVLRSRTCGGCAMTGGKMKACGRCRSVFYCSLDCQGAHWPTHAVTCRNALCFTVVPSLAEQMQM
jgi:hypothetical protein